MTTRTQQTGNKNNVNRRPASDLPLFARSKETPKFPEPIPLTMFGRTSVYSRHLVWTLAALTCGLLIAIARPDSAQNSPVNHLTSHTVAARQVTTPRRVSVTPLQAVTPSVEPQVAGDDTAGDGRRPVDFYTQSISNTLFNAPQPPPIKAVVVAPPPKVVPEKKPKPIPVAVPEVNPFADWTYTGTIVMDDQTIALLENKKTSEGNFVKVGDTLNGSQVQSVTKDEVTLSWGKKPITLAKSDAMNVTPLDRSAAPISTQPQPAAQPGQPGQPIQATPQFTPGQFSGRGNRGFGGRGGAQLTPEQIQQFRAMRLNNNFNN